MKNFFIVGIFNSANEFISLIIFLTLFISLFHQQIIQKYSGQEENPALKYMSFAFICNSIVLLLRQMMHFEKYSGDAPTLLALFIVLQILFPAIYYIANKDESFIKRINFFIGTMITMTVINLLGLLLIKLGISLSYMAISIIKSSAILILIGFTLAGITNFRTQIREQANRIYINKNHHYESALFVTSLVISFFIIFQFLFSGVGHHYGPVVLTLTLINTFVFFRVTNCQKRRNDDLNAEIRNDSKLLKLEDSKANDLKERLVRYFEKEKPYLNKDLSINEVSLYLYTNKTYLSKIINDNMGQNFNQFINSFRIEEVQRLFQENNNISIQELCKLSGFGCMASFTIAFRIFLGSSPADWCKANRNQLDNNEETKRF
jgi:AraC-like DNA-binding protein